VLGGGGVVGGAFHAGVLAALERTLGFDARRAQLIIGTSAGSMSGAYLRGGLAPRDLLARACERTLSAEGQAVIARLPPPPIRAIPRLEWRDLGRSMAAPGALRRAWLHPWRVRIGSIAAAALPEGKVPSLPIAEFLAPLFPRGWPALPFWVCTVSLHDARRVVFGRDSSAASVGEAVAASCAVPGVFTPVQIGAERYVDGGAHSVTNLDLAADAGLDLVLVSSPMSIAGRALRWSADFPMRLALRAQLAREAALLRLRGVRVVALQPSAEDLDVMGLDAMDPSKRRPVAEQVYASTLRRLEQTDLRERLASLTA